MKQPILNITIWLLVIGAFSMTNCGGSDDDDPGPITNPSPKACILTQIRNDAGYKLTLEYNNQGYVNKTTEINTNLNTEKVTTYIYDNNNKVIRQDFTEKGVNAGYTTYTYGPDGQLSTSQTYKNGNLIQTQNFVRNTQGQVERITDSDGSVTDFIYNSAGNITKINSTTENDPSMVEFIGYDDKKSPFSSVKGYLNTSAYSKNNPLEEKAYYGINGEEDMIRYVYTYEYNELGLPVSIAEFRDWGAWSGTTTANLTYQCN